MSCSHFEDRIALHVGGDLPRDQIHEVESHLRACPACAQLATELALGRVRLAALRAEGVSTARLASVRAGVVARLADSEAAKPPPVRPFPRRRPSAALALAAMLALAVGLAAFWLARRPAGGPDAPSPAPRIADAGRPLPAPLETPDPAAPTEPPSEPSPAPRAPRATRPMTNAPETGTPVNGPGVTDPPASGNPGTSNSVTPNPETPFPLPPTATATARPSAAPSTESTLTRLAQRPRTTFIPPTIQPHQPAGRIRTAETHTAEARPIEAEPLRIQLVSDDDLVIHWLVDTEEHTDAISD